MEDPTLERFLSGVRAEAEISRDKNLENFPPMSVWHESRGEIEDVFLRNTGDGIGLFARIGSQEALLGFGRTLEMVFLGYMERIREEYGTESWEEFEEMLSRKRGRKRLWKWFSGRNRGPKRP